MSNNALELKNVTKKYERFTLDNISFDLPKGCIMGLIGENGAGKSTTINLIMNTLARNAGEIKVLGCESSSREFNQIKERIGVVLDEAYFPEVITPCEVNKIMAKTYANWSTDTFYNYIEEFRLPEKQRFKEYSRGMKMKLAIAVALSHGAELLILDEATSGLDPIIRDEILNIFYDFTRDPNHSILISSHIVSDLEKLCDYITFLHRGKMLFCDEKDVILEKYGVANCGKELFATIPDYAVVGVKESNYGVQCLVKRDEVSPSLNVEKVSLEDIILYMVKGERK